MKRRAFIRSTSISAASAALATTSTTRLAGADDSTSVNQAATTAPQPSPGSSRQHAASSEKFSMAFAPHFGMFASSAGTDLVDQLSFAADNGFHAWEDNAMKDRPVEQQNELSKTMERLGIQMGVVSALRGFWKNVSFAGDDVNTRQEILKGMREIIDVAKCVRTKYLTVVLGLEDKKLPRDYQTANAIELLKRCCDVVEPHGLVMVLEPLNRKRNHPGVFLHESPHAYQICRAVGRPSCKILFDIYHQQITEGNLIPNIDRCWKEIAYFQCGDNPGRKEPGTGEIHFKNLLSHIAANGYQGILGMEHGNSMKGVDGERAVINAYRAIDPA